MMMMMMTAEGIVPWYLFYAQHCPFLVQDIPSVHKFTKLQRLPYVQRAIFTFPFFLRFSNTFIWKFSFGKFSLKFLGSENLGRSWFWFKCSRPAFRGDVCVINGLKNLKDFRGEITLLNIENSPGPNHRKCRILRENPNWICSFLAVFDYSEHWVRRLQLVIRKLGKRRQNGMGLLDHCAYI